MAVGTLGLELRVQVTAASVPEREGRKQVLKAVYQMTAMVARLFLIGVDGGYSVLPFAQWTMERVQGVIHVALRPEQIKGFVLLKQRGVGDDLQLHDSTYGQTIGLSV